MLHQLTIRNFVLIEFACMDCETGFHVITGESGAGKSLIVQALSLLCGSQASDDYIQPNHTQAIIEAVFDSHSLPASMRDDLNIMDDDQLIVQRIIKQLRPAITKINGHTVTVKQLKAVMAHVMYISSQHHVYALLDSSNHLGYLDAFIGDALTAVLNEYKHARTELRKMQQRLHDCQSQHDHIQAKRHDLLMTIQDIESQEFQPDEDEQLAIQKHQLKTITEQRESLNHVLNQVDIISHALHQMDAVAYPLSSDEFNGIEQLEVYRDTHQLIHQKLMDLDSMESLDVTDINHRLDAIFTYKLKYGEPSVNALLNRLAQSKTDLNQLNNQTSTMTTYQKDYDQQTNIVANLAKQLTGIRLNHAPMFEASIHQALSDLGMPDATIQLHVHASNDWMHSGADELAILFSANPNREPKPLKQAASGGELSRLMLAMMVANPNGMRQPCIVFDEVDVGIGGETGNALGRMLRTISTTHQLFVVTHLAQVAMQATVHYKLEKTMKHNENYVNIKQIHACDMQVEIQRMIGGSTVSSAIR